MEKTANETGETGLNLVYTAYITLKNGKRLYTKQFGLKAFCFEAKDKKTDQ